MAASSMTHPVHVASTEAPFTWPVRIYWEDTDAGGIVYYANYLKFMERARTEWLRAAGIEQLPLKEQHGLMFVVVDIEAQYRQPARYGDELLVTCTIVGRRRASLTFRQQVYRGGLQGEVLVEGKVRVACLDAVNLRPTALPKELMRSDRE
ncbi:MAG TPA: tol-pal system-associated acyl-CoA thioesterase [Steroidobacter sp.]|uniref:tol-pal system-associated acyl-CoA thioesterase n=1 Tax=Steroidobacter sp. TaxID=1978227 RepID=UPI002ED9B796